MRRLIFISHPEVVVDPAISIQRWHLTQRGIERMRTFSSNSVVRDVSAIWSSTEAKAIEAAGILAGALGLAVNVRADLGEHDRSATGFLPPAEFEETANAFFATPERSIRGWERATDAQARIVAAVDAIVTMHDCGDVAIVSHGAVGTLLFAAWAGRPIDRTDDQPNQGHYWIASLPDRVPDHGWRPIAPR